MKLAKNFYRDVYLTDIFFSIMLDSLGQNDNRKATLSCCSVTDILNIT